MSHITADRAYAEGAPFYLPEWSPIPIKTIEGNKIPLVKGFSGYEGAYADAEQVARWVANPHFNGASLGLRLPKDVVGIDLDCYGDKQGARSVAALQGLWGKLDRTWVSTSRTDGSGIHLYRLPESAEVARMKNPKLGFGGIDLVRYCHRFVTAWPTYHGRESGRHQYLWFNPEGKTDPAHQVIPLPEDLPLLPNGWVKGLATGREYEHGDTKLGEMQASEWLKARPNGNGPMCEVMQSGLANYVEQIKKAGRAGGCYPAANQGIFALVGNAAEGHAGGYLAVKRLWESYRDAMNARRTDKRDPQTVGTEFNNSLRGAIEKLPKRKFSNTDPCEWEL